MMTARAQNSIVVLLGAGASVDAGLLTSFALTEAIYTDLRGNWIQQSKLSRLVGYLIAKLQLRKAKQGDGPFQAIDIEELFDALNSLLNRNTSVLSEFVERWDGFLDTFDDEIDVHAMERGFASSVMDVVRRNIDRRGGFPDTFGLGSQLRSFVSALRPKSHFGMTTREADLFRAPFMQALVSRLTTAEEAGDYFSPLLSNRRVGVVATLNYDLVVENCCKRIDREYDHGLSRWDQQRSLNWKTGGQLRLLTLHGSVNWTGTPDEVTVNPGEVHPNQRRVMVFGGAGQKLSASGPFLQFLTSFERAIMKSGHLLVIGYSFRDAHINAVLRRWRLTRRQSKLTIVDPGVPILRDTGLSAGVLERQVGGKTATYVLDVEHIKAGAAEGIQRFFDEPTLV